MNTQNVKVRIFEEENKTTLTIKRSTREDDATYVCKATSEIGMTLTKAKLRVDVSEFGPKPEEEFVEEEEKVEIKKKEEKSHKKKKPEVKKAKEIKEKVKTERVKVETEEIHEERLVPKEQPEEKSVIVYFGLSCISNLLRSRTVIF